MSKYRRQHYVPEWYQKGFVGSDNNLFYLDLNPYFLSIPGRGVKVIDGLRKSGPDGCFAEKDIYTTFFPEGLSTQIEEKFFGGIDGRGPGIFKAFINFDHEEFDPRFFDPFIVYMSLQKMRTPKGLRSLHRFLGLKKKNDVLFEMQRLQKIYCAIWTDCVWQIASAEKSAIKFLLSDSPITLYNRAASPKSRDCVVEGDPGIAQYGTHTIFPLSESKIIILTNAAYLRDPWKNPRDIIPNPMPFRDSVFTYLDLQLRELDEHEVNEINFIIKKRAFRFIAARNKDWLFPERAFENCRWDMLGSGDLLMPDPRSHKFTTKTILGYEDGRSMVFDSNHIKKGRPGYTSEPTADARDRFGAFQSFFSERHGPKMRGRAYTFGGLDKESESGDYFDYQLRKATEYLKKWGRPPFYR